ncbi:MAG: hypothetical protein ACOY3Y_16640 [Acidobacteriota bacterium]
MRGVLRHVAGWGLLCLGVAGLFLPILQGWLLIALGALLLAPDVPLFARIVCWVEDRHPRVRGVLEALRRKIGQRRHPC